MKEGGWKVASIFLAIATAVIFISASSMVAVSHAAPASLKEMSEAFVQISEKVTPAVVNISSSKKMASGPGGEDLEPFFKNHPFREFFGDDFLKRFKQGPPQGKGFRQQGMGSGVVVSPDGYILTNSHVVKDADEIKVTLADKRSFTAKVVGVDSESDLAVIKIDAKNLPTAKLGDSDKLRVGDIVVAIGNPFGLNQTVTSGIVSAKGRTNVGIIDYEDFIQTDAAINPGNSGGPLVNIDGEVVGINTAIATRSGGYQGIGFAIPSNSASLIKDSLVKEGKVRRGQLGVVIQDLNESLAKSFGRQDQAGALVSQVLPGSPAEKAGLKSGDIIVKFNDHAVSSAAELKNLVGKTAPGTSSTVAFVRDTKASTVNVKIDERDAKKVAALQSSGSPETSNELGLEMENVSSSVAQKMGLKEGQGVRVSSLEQDGVGARMGLKTGDVVLEVDGNAIADVGAFNKAVTAAKKNGVIRVKVQRGKNQIFLGSSMG